VPWDVELVELVVKVRFFVDGHRQQLPGDAG
jgi:hypothetical protein